MKYKLKVFKQTTTLSELTVSITADSYKEAISKFNNNLHKVESSSKFKEVESTTVFCVDKLFELEPLVIPQTWKLTDDEFKALECLVLENIDQWDIIPTVDGSWDYLEYDTHRFDVNFWTDEYNRRRLAVYLIPDGEEEPDYANVYSFIIHFNGNSTSR